MKLKDNFILNRPLSLNMGFVVIAPVGDNLDAFFIGMKEFATEKVYLITPENYLKKANSLQKKLDVFSIPVKIIKVKGSLMESMFSSFGEICSLHDNDNILVNVATGDRLSTCAALSAAFANGLKAFGIMDKKPIGNIKDKETLLQMAWRQKTYPELVTKNVLDYEGCKDCQWSLICAGGCPVVSSASNGSAASATTYDADMTVTGTAGATTFTQGMDIDASIGVTSTTLATTIGPVTISADMYDENDAATTVTAGGLIADSGDNRSVTVSLDAPIGDATIGLDDTGDVTVTGTFSGVTVAHTVQDGADTTTGSASIAGMDITLTNDAGSTEWTIGTTVAGTAVTVGSDKSVSATFGVTGNTVVVTHTAERASAASTTATKYSTAQKDAYTTIAVARDLTSGAALSATYNTFDSSLTLKASVAF